MSPELQVTIIGGGLAGSEAAWQLLRRGVSVDLIEARPEVTSPAHHGLLLGELVCSNSLRSDVEGTAPGLLKTELRRLGSLIMSAADATRVPAGSALAVDRDDFAWHITGSLLRQPGFRLRRHAVREIPATPTILASGPLTSRGLAAALEQRLEGRLYFYDAIAPIVEASSLNWEVVFAGARRDPESGDYINCPLDRDQYQRLVTELISAQQVRSHAFEEPRYFEGCLPVEVMAGRGRDALAFGPLRPVGLTDPRTGRRPFAVLQLRAEDRARSSYNMVGFQTRLIQSEQRRIFRLIPGMEQVRFLRYGSIHRNSYLDAPRVLGPRLQLLTDPEIKVAGQISGVEGYLESTSMGMLAGFFMAAELQGRSLDPPPPTTALGGLYAHLTRPHGAGQRFEPAKITFGLIPPMEGKFNNKRSRRLATRERALEDIDRWSEHLREVQQ